MTDGGAVIVRVRRQTQVLGAVAAFVFAALLAWGAISGPGPNPARGFNPYALWAVAALLTLVGLAMVRRMLQRGWWETVIDAEGVRDGAGDSMRWPEVYKVGYTSDEREIWLAPHPEADGRQIFIDVYDSDTPAGEVLAAIERFSRAAGRDLDVPTPPARASARSR